MALGSGIRAKIPDAAIRPAEVLGQNAPHGVMATAPSGWHAQMCCLAAKRDAATVIGDNGYFTRRLHVFLEPFDLHVAQQLARAAHGFSECQARLMRPLQLLHQALEARIRVRQADFHLEQLAADIAFANRDRVVCESDFAGILVRAGHAGAAHDFELEGGKQAARVDQCADDSGRLAHPAEQHRRIGRGNFGFRVPPDDTGIFGLVLAHIDAERLPALIVDAQAYGRALVFELPGRRIEIHDTAETEIRGFLRQTIGECCTRHFIQRGAIGYFKTENAFGLHWIRTALRT